MITTAGNLPAPLTSFTGRRREVAEIQRLLGEVRLLTLTGAGGVGKTRLALEAATGMSKSFPDGLWLIDLAPVPDPAMVAPTIASTLRLPDLGTRPALDQITDHLTHNRALIVLDNCEHLVDASAELAKKLLLACPGLRLLTTSRQTLGVTGEHVLPVPPLSIPDEAIELLQERAIAVRPDFRITDSNRAQAIQLCTELDGLPLAIELAASRLRTLPVDQLTDRLRNRFALLNGGCRTKSPRQRTLHGMIEWSYDLCTPAERLLWNRLSVFVGGFGLDAAEEVCAGEGIAEHEVLDLLDRLVAQSVVLATEAEGLHRYRLLETIREYGRARLTESGGEQRVLRRHRDFFLALAERTAAAWFGPGQEETLTRLRAEHCNLLVALDLRRTAVAEAQEHPRARLELSGPEGPEDAEEVEEVEEVDQDQDQDQADGQTTLRLATALRFHWCADGFLREGRRQFERLLAATPEPTPVRARALWAAAWVALLQGALATADQWLDEAEELGERLNDPSVLPYVHGFRGASAAFRGRMEEAVPLYEEALAAHRAAGEGPEMLFWQFQVAITQAHLGDPRSADTSRRAVEVAKAHGERLFGSYALWALGYALWADGDTEEGLSLTRAALETLRGFNDYAGTAAALEVFTWITASRGHHERAAQLLGSVYALSREIGACPVSTLGQHRAHCRETVLSALGETGYDKAVAEGARHDSPAQAIALALDPGTDTGQGTAATATNSLTCREQEVAALVAKGMTNRKIATMLSLSPRTADRHIENIRAKLGVSSRAQIAAWWVESRGSLP
ncbi:LuxR C-terminal-related transcriptional regulator [Streptomyces sp. VNUA24]|uniref:ATP-binding protein n=1 Tax=Streptomyces sp. VNUA24 TaxID=3031131 RepID=UPI0023B87105|nr:LuxR C-terminal-related transcriptional regulator [Streptomyces sp. VNUA24]WEH13054.1 LuxR C-terminal-related transcriptional regulator [Streptomyces sp. VNUA24]